MQAELGGSSALGPVAYEDLGIKKPHSTEEKIAHALKQAELGIAVGLICRKLGISEATFYVCWRRRVGKEKRGRPAVNRDHRMRSAVQQVLRT